MEGELLTRYRFHLAVQGLTKQSMSAERQMQHMIKVLMTHSQLSAGDFAKIRGTLNSIHHDLVENLQKAKSLPAPALSNVPAGLALYNLIVDRGDRAMPRLPEGQITAEWLTKLIERVQAVLGRLKRVHFKSLGGLLSFQEQLAEQARSQRVKK